MYANAQSLPIEIRQFSKHPAHGKKSVPNVASVFQLLDETQFQVHGISLYAKSVRSRRIASSFIPTERRDRRVELMDDRDHFNVSCILQALGLAIVALFSKVTGSRIDICGGKFWHTYATKKCDRLPHPPSHGKALSSLPCSMKMIVAISTL